MELSKSVKMIFDVPDINASDKMRGLLVVFMVFLMSKVTIQWWRPYQQKNLPPGPWGIPFIGAAPLIALSKFSPQETFLQWSKVYGKVFSMWVGKRIFVVLNDYDLIQQALHHPEMQDRPTQTIEAIMKSTGANHGVSSGNGLFWREQRKFMHSNLRELGVIKKVFEEKIQAEVEEFSNEICNLDGKAFNPYSLLTCASSNIICGFAWGRRYSYDHPELRQLISIVTRAATHSISASALGTFPWLRHIPIGPHMKVINVFKEFHVIIDRLIQERQSDIGNSNSNGEIECLLDAYLQELDAAAMGKGSFQEPLKKGSIYSNLVNLFFAGSDTVAVTVTWVLLHFLWHPDIQTKCQEELDRVVGWDRTPRFMDRSQMPYLQATIAEVQRISNVAPIGIPHSTSSSVTFNGLHIPKKAMLIMNLHSVMTDPKLWDQPDKFNPERFLGKDGSFVKNPHLIAFGTGPRKCLGEQVAQMELFIFVATLLHQFKFSVPAGETLPSREGITGVTYKPRPFKLCATSRLTSQ